jgi:hypothetical protein
MGYLGYKPADKPLTAADITDSIITSAKIADGTIANTDISTTAGITLNKVSGNPSFRNAIINGDFAVAQRATSFTSTGSANNDDTYTLDRWYVLSDGNDIIDVTQETSVVPTNQLNAIALDVETINKKFGIAQIIEQKNCVGLIGNTVTLSFKAKVSATTKLDNVKCAIVAWSGTADTVTSDIISAWGVEGTNPTLIANATYENTPANLSVTTSYATYSVSAAVDTVSTKNIIVFIWSDVTDTTLGDFLYITDVQLEKGSAASDFEYLPIDVDLTRCLRYYEKSYPLATSPGTAIQTGARFSSTLSSNTTSYLSLTLQYTVPKRNTPTLTFYDMAGTSGKCRRDTFGVGGSDAQNISSQDLSETSALVFSNGTSSNQVMIVHFTAVAEL